MAQAAKEGLRIEKMDVDLPADVAYAQAYIRTYPDFDKVPKKDRVKWLQMSEILKQFRASPQSQLPETSGAPGSPGFQVEGKDFFSPGLGLGL